MLAVCQKPVVASLHAGGQFAAKELSIRAPDDLAARPAKHQACLLYTSDAADERSSVDLGGRRIIKKKKQVKYMDLSDSMYRNEIKESTRGR